MTRPLQLDSQQIARIRAVCEAHDREESQSSIARRLQIARNTVAADLAARQRAGGSLEDYLLGLAPTGALSDAQRDQRRRERERKRAQRARALTPAVAAVATRVRVSDITYTPDMSDAEFKRWHNFTVDVGQLDTDAVRAHLAKRMAYEAQMITRGAHAAWTLGALAAQLPAVCTESCETGHTSSVDFFDTMTSVLTKWGWCVDSEGVWRVSSTEEATA